MKITRYRPILPDMGPWPALGEMPSRFRRLFEDYFDTLPAESLGWSPAVDITDADGEMVLTAELPGLAREDVQLTIADGVLILTGEKKEEKEKKDTDYRLVERCYGAFERRFTLPRSVDADHIRAEFEEGVLKVRMPKTPAAVGKKVEIGAK